MKTRFFIVASLIVITGYSQKTDIVVNGQMPAVAVDDSKNIHLVYGNEDSIFYCISKDQGKTFSSPALISILPGLAASHTRGPQLVVTSNRLAVTACNSSGNIFSYTKGRNGKWQSGARVNDLDTTAKENLMALAASGDNVYAVWLDLRNKHNEIFGARSTDGGKTWSKNIKVYASPDLTVCECCKPSVAMKGGHVYVMFRNWINGNRDLYLASSTDGGNSFPQAAKLGFNSWPLNGCPMDGGNLVINDKNKPQTVWRRENMIYACEPGGPEKEIGEGRSCTLESVNGKNVYAWIQNRQVVYVNSNGSKTILGNGQLPVLKALNNKYAICIWENDKIIQKAIVEI